MNRKITRTTLGAALAALISGCAVGPDFQKPETPHVDSYTSTPLPGAASSSPDASAVQTQKFMQGMDIPDQWWTLFHSPSLNQLVTEALRANPNLTVAQATLRQAQENYYAARGALFPAFNANGAVTREQTNGAEYGAPNTPGALFTLYNASVNVSYGLDIFGLARRTLEAAGAQQEFERFQLEAAYLTLTSNVVTSAVQEASLRAQIAATREIIDVEKQQLDMLQQQFGVGGVSESSVLAQKTVLEQAVASLPALEKQLALTRNQLAVLAGRFPSQKLTQTFDLDTLQLPRELPVSLPSKLVEQRPDVLASESLLHVASAQIGVATANMFPQISLAAGVGFDAASADSLFSAASRVWNVGANLSQPIFRGGTLLHQRRAAIAAYDSAEAQYRSTVLAAFEDVANVLDALQYDASVLQAQTIAAQSADDSLEIARKQYQVGAASYQTLLNAEQAYQQTRIALAQAKAARYADSAALFQSLGGGWWNRTESAGEQNKGANK